MKIIYDKALTEDVVFREIKKREFKGQDSLTGEYYRRHQEIYEKRDDRREKLFEALHGEFFESLGFHKPIIGVLGEFPEFSGRIRTLVAIRALAAGDEEASLSNEADMIGLRIMPQRFFDHGQLQAFLRHELKHLSDMIDTAFRYRKQNSLGFISPAQENVIRSRYKILWDIFIDGRLERAGENISAAREARISEFEELYRSIPGPKLNSIFETLWNSDSLTHDNLIEMAKDYRVLMDKTLNENIKDSLSGEQYMLPGGLCPLCKFPTFSWTQDIESDENRSLLVKIKNDYPWWDIAQGVCERCIEVYREWEEFQIQV